MITKTIPISMSIVINYAMKQDIPFDWKSMETEKGEDNAEHILESEEINPKEQGCKNHILGSQ